MEHLAWLWEEYAQAKWRDSDHGLKMLMYFWFGVEPGDMVIARAGVTKYIGLGEFQEEPYYDKGASGLTWGCSLRRVLWEPTPTLRNSPVRFSQITLYPLGPEKAALFRF